VLAKSRFTKRLESELGARFVKQRTPEVHEQLMAIVKAVPLEQRPPALPSDLPSRACSE